MSSLTEDLERFQSKAVGTLVASRFKHKWTSAFAASARERVRRRVQTCNGSNPLLKLPDALLYAIVHHDTSIREPVSQVCRRLRSWVLGTPELWTALSLERVTCSMPPSWIAQLLQYSGSAHLQQLTLDFDAAMTLEQFRPYCLLLEANLCRTRDLTLHVPSPVHWTVLSAALRGPAPLLERLDFSIHWGPLYPVPLFAELFTAGAPRLAFLTCRRVHHSTYWAPNLILSGLRVLVLDGIPHLRSAVQLDQLVCFMPRLETLSIRVVWLDGAPLAPAAFASVLPNLRRLRIVRLRRNIVNVLDFCAALGIDVLALDTGYVSASRDSDLTAVFPIITAISVGIAVSEIVARRAPDAPPLRVLYNPDLNVQSLSMLLVPAMQHLTSLALHESFWPDEEGVLDALPVLARLRVLLASCRDYRDLSLGAWDDDNGSSVFAAARAPWARLPALQTVHISYHLAAPCAPETVRARGCCSCRAATSLALSDMCAFASRCLHWGADQRVALRLTGVHIVDVDPWPYLQRLRAVFADVSISERSEPETCDAARDVWSAPSPTAIFAEPLVAVT